MNDEFGASGTFENGVFKPYGEEVKPEPSGPFASLSESVQTSLKDAGITTLEQAKALGKAGLVKLPNIGEITAMDILAL